MFEPVEGLTAGNHSFCPAMTSSPLFYQQSCCAFDTNSWHHSSAFAETVPAMFVNVDLLALATNANYFSTLAATSGTSPAISLLVYNSTFQTDVLGVNATATKLADFPWQAFHEGGIYYQPDNSVYVSSNFVSLDDPIDITTISLDDFTIGSSRFPSVYEANGGSSYFPPDRKSVV